MGGGWSPRRRVCGLVLWAQAAMVGAQPWGDGAPIGVPRQGDTTCGRLDHVRVLEFVGVEGCVVDDSCGWFAWGEMERKMR